MSSPSPDALVVARPDAGIPARGTTWTETTAWVVLAVGLVATGLATRAAQVDLATRDRARFDEHLQTMVSAIDRRMTAYADLLLATRAAGGANPAFYTTPVWHRYVDALDVGTRYPGSRGIGILRRVDAPGVPTEAQMAKELDGAGRPDWRIWPQVTAPTDRYPLTLYRSYDARRFAAYGYDHASDPTRREAIHRARDTGKPALSGRVIPVVRAREERIPSFLLYVPVYEGDQVPPDVASRRAKIRAIVMTSFRAGDLFRDVFGPVGAGRLGWRVYDGERADPDKLLVAHDLAPEPAEAQMEGRVVMSIAGRHWLLDAWTPAGMPLGGPPHVPWLVGLGGLAISLALFGLTWSLASARRRAMVLAATMTADLRAADRAKDEWLSVISHELRTPLNFITGFASLLDDDVGGELSATQHGYVQKINAGADRMLALVNDLLDVAKIQAGKFDLMCRPTVLAPLVEEVIGSLRPLAEAKEQRLTVEVSAELASLAVSVDGPRVVQVLTNLVSNAVKFTPPGGSIHVDVRRATDAVTVAVRDTGVGIAAEDVPKLFEPFRQLDMSATRAVGGTGLGLSICKALVEAHRGRIGVNSTPGMGSTFWFGGPGG